jgi:hypothetical protein
MTSFEDKLGYLLKSACVELGFCLPWDAAEAILKRKSITASEFASEVLKAEGLEPDDKWFEPLALLFRQHFGKQSVSAQDFE